MENQIDKNKETIIQEDLKIFQNDLQKFLTNYNKNIINSKQESGISYNIRLNSQELLTSTSFEKEK